MVGLWRWSFCGGGIEIAIVTLLNELILKTGVSITIRLIWNMVVLWKWSLSRGWTTNPIPASQNEKIFNIKLSIQIWWDFRSFCWNAQHFERKRKKNLVWFVWPPQGFYVFFFFLLLLVTSSLGVWAESLKVYFVVCSMRSNGPWVTCSLRSSGFTDRDCRSRS